MKVLVFGLTALVVILFIWQYQAVKGDWSHRSRGLLIGFCSVLVVALNTISIHKRGYIWDTAFITHTVLGSGFFVGLVLTSVLGWLTWLHKVPTSWHRYSSSVTGVFLFFTLVAAILVHFVR